LLVSAGKSFVRYEGTWTLAPAGTGTELTCALTAEPAFRVPGFLLRSLLNRDARVMIDRLRAAIRARAAAPPAQDGFERPNFSIR
jgi:hypothetical protein